MPYAYEFIHTL